MRILNVFEVAEMELWPLWEYEDIDDHGRQDARDDLNAVEYSAYLQAIENSRFRAILNEKIPPVSPERDLPPSRRFNLISEEIRRERGHPGVRWPGWAETISQLAAVAHERREVSDGLSRVLSSRQSGLRTWHPCVLRMLRAGPRLTRPRSTLRASSVPCSTSTAILAIPTCSYQPVREGTRRTCHGNYRSEMTPQKIADLFIPDMAAWYENAREPNGSIRTNVMAVGLVMIEHMDKAFPLDEKRYVTKKGGQVSLLGGPRVKRILASHGETRSFTSEAGRSSRGSIDHARQLAHSLNNSPGVGAYLSVSGDDREEVRHTLQGWVVDRMKVDYFDQQRIQAEVDHTKPLKFAVKALLKAASVRGGTTSGAVAQHLVGAKLTLRFPDETVHNESYTTADQQTHRQADFQVGDTAFHVTMRPSNSLISNRCRANLTAKFRPVVLVPEEFADVARGMVALESLDGHVAVVSIEDFVGINIEEIGTFSEKGIRTALKNLLTRYNERVKAVEPDPGLLIEIPGNL